MKTSLERQLHPAVVSLMCGTIIKGLLKGVHTENTFNKWVDSKLIRISANTDDYILTANGSLFVNDMINDLKGNIGSYE